MQYIRQIKSNNRQNAWSLTSNPPECPIFFQIRLITYIIKCCKPGGGGSVVEGGGGAALGGSKVQLSSSW